MKNLVLLSALLINFLMLESAQAFSCQKMSIKERFDSADVVFIGKVKANENSDGRSYILFDVKETFKLGKINGSQLRTIRARTQGMSGFIGEQGLEYVVYASFSNDDSGLIHVNQCNTFLTPKMLLKQYRNNKPSHDNLFVFTGSVISTENDTTKRKKETIPIKRIVFSVDEVVKQSNNKIKVGDTREIRTSRCDLSFNKAEKVLLVGSEYIERIGNPKERKSITRYGVTCSDFDFINIENKLHEFNDMIEGEKK
ncbi:hypothetical protein [Seonamhaeicola marinus]|uniref:Uncharacterized protein n=1 Tax=Seonamhaeicola marinus TaxID=1912246 RepID=A0A5D0HUF3_9FLAO|nr:hypothetical protein [Seonamhaeicola marinus]TYA74936.1 hypothetical protein FUA24_16690 [Seonamhaeicola marinus]